VAVVDPLACAAFLVAAFVLSGVVHTAWLRSPLSRPLAIPLDGGVELRGRRLLGDNKTVRGFAAIVPATGATFATLAWVLGAGDATRPPGLWALGPLEYGLLGLGAGFGFMVGELPNSFVKRQLGIAPGTVPSSRLPRLACLAADRLDSILGMLATVSLLVPTPWLVWAYVLTVGPAIHLGFSALLFAAGVKARAA
jgi:CDP-2,3-bis-(O-geranylgeranyl)-sn-glycerol synthase